MATLQTGAMSLIFKTLIKFGLYYCVDYAISHPSVDLKKSF